MIRNMRGTAEVEATALIDDLAQLTAMLRSDVE